MPNYYCQGSAELVDGRGSRHMNVGGQGIDAAVAAAFLAALQPAALHACLQAAEQLEHGHDAALDQHRRQVEQARYQAVKAERRYRAVDPENRLVARGLETEWNTALQQLADAEAELARRQTARPKTLTPAERAAILALGDDLGQVWDAPTTTDKDRKQLLRTLLEEVNITARRDDPDPHARLVLRWKGGAITELTVPLRRPQPKIRTDDDTVDLIRRLAVHYPDAKIAGILNRQGRRTPRGLSYTAGRVQGLRHHWGIPRHQPGHQRPRGRRTAQRGPGRPPARHRALDPAALAQRRLHRRRASHPRRARGACASPISCAACSPTAPPTAGRPAPRQPRPRHLPPDRIAEGQARRAARRPDPHRTQERPAYRDPRPARRPVLTGTMSKGAV